MVGIPFGVGGGFTIGYSIGGLGAAIVLAALVGSIFGVLYLYRHGTDELRGSDA